MAARKDLRTSVAQRPTAATAVLSVLGYALVAASFLGYVPFPTLSRAGVILLSDAIAVINSVALVCLILGFRAIRRGQRRRHRRLMLTAFSLILLFLSLYIWKQAGGFTKGFVISRGQFLAGHATAVTYAYWLMLGVHVLLSIVAVPVVIHAVILGITTPLDRVGTTIHPTVGRIALFAWGLSLALGILTYLMLNHVYGWERIEGAIVPLTATVGRSGIRVPDQ
ncbi:MAG: DUF420 domain-containing protein [Halodesulfurarchaeum sp.]